MSRKDILQFYPREEQLEKVDPIQWALNNRTESILVKLQKIFGGRHLEVVSRMYHPEHKEMTLVLDETQRRIKPEYSDRDRFPEITIHVKQDEYSVGGLQGAARDWILGKLCLEMEEAPLAQLANSRRSA